jgi:hypothetical protein
MGAVKIAFFFDFILKGFEFFRNEAAYRFNHHPLFIV